MEKEELKALEIVRNEMAKIKVKYQKKAEKEREKVNDVFVTVCGEKCYTETEINDWYETDYITSSQADRYIEKLNKKKSAAGQKGTLTKSERIYRVFENIINNLTAEIQDIKIKQEREQKSRSDGRLHRHRDAHIKSFLRLRK